MICQNVYTNPKVFVENFVFSEILFPSCIPEALSRNFGKSRIMETHFFLLQRLTDSFNAYGSFRNSNISMDLDESDV